MSSGDKERVLKHAEHVIGYSFGNSHFLREALTHRSHSVENPISPVGDNGRLSHVGDAVISLVVSEYLFSVYPDLTAGGISTVRAAVVSGKSLARASRRLRLGRFMYLGKGESSDGGHEKESILGDLFEAVVGAVYCDGGLGAAQIFVLRQLKEDIDKAISSL